MAHAHGQNVHLCPVIVPGVGSGQKLPHLCKKAAGLGVVGVGGRDRHQAAQTDVLPGGGSLQKREQAVGVHAALAGLLADVDLDEDVLHQPQTGRGGIDLIQKARAVHALDQRGAAYDLVDLVRL